jgi:hypothetical protein
MAAIDPQEVKVCFKDVVVDSIPSVELSLEVDPVAKTLPEPTPAMWVSIYLAHKFKTGELMTEVNEFITKGQFVSPS